MKKKTLISFSLSMVILASMAAGGIAVQNADKEAVATLAGGCFWCLEPPFDELAGVISTTPGYTGGGKKDPSYEEVSTGRTGHVEAVRIRYDESVVPYAKLLEVFWKNIDPTQAGGQFADMGPQYETVIFYHTEDQRREAMASRDRLNASGKYAGPIVTRIEPAGAFYPAEEHHQDYYVKNPGHYGSYKKGSGRADYIRKMSG